MPDPLALTWEKHWPDIKHTQQFLDAKWPNTFKLQKTQIHYHKKDATDPDANDTSTRKMAQ